MIGHVLGGVVPGNGDCPIALRKGLFMVVAVIAVEKLYLGCIVRLTSAKG